MTKRIMLAMIVFLSTCLMSCEMFEDTKECTVNDPCPGLAEFGGYICSGNSSTGEVSLGFGVTSLSSEIDEIYFGTVTAYGGSETYTNGVTGYVGKISTPEGVEVWAYYDKQFKTLTNVDTSLERFDQVTVQFDLEDGQSTRELIFKNMPITWN